MNVTRKRQTIHSLRHAAGVEITMHVLTETVTVQTKRLNNNVHNNTVAKEREREVGTQTQTENRSPSFH